VRLRVEKGSKGLGLRVEKEDPSHIIIKSLRKQILSAHNEDSKKNQRSLIKTSWEAVTKRQGRPLLDDHQDPQKQPSSRMSMQSPWLHMQDRYQSLIRVSWEAVMRRPAGVKQTSDTLFWCCVSMTDTHVWLSKSHTLTVSSSEPEYKKVRWGSSG